MDIEGIWAQLCFPNFGGFAGSTFYAAEDKDFAKLCISAYNDFILDEWCAYAPERQIPLVMVPFWDVEASVAEIERTAAKGAKSVSFIEAPHRLGLPSLPHRPLGPDPARLRGSRTCRCRCTSAPAACRRGSRRTAICSSASRCSG